MSTARRISMTEQEIEALCERAASRVLKKMGCPDPDQDPAGAAVWAADVQTGVNAVKAARESITKWLGRGILFIVAAATAWLTMRTAGAFDGNWFSHQPKQ